jgi:FG-GAP repeat protein
MAASKTRAGDAVHGSPFVRGSVETDERFGDATAAGDFDGDGFDDLAIGDWGATIDTFKAAGQVHIVYCGPSGLTIFGSGLGVGDFNNDGRAGIAIGVQGETLRAVPPNNPIAGRASGVEQVLHRELAPGQRDGRDERLLRGHLIATPRTRMCEG